MIWNSSLHPLRQTHCLSHSPTELPVVNNDWFGGNKRKAQIWANPKVDAELIWDEAFLAATLKQPAVHGHGNGHWDNYHALCLQHYCHYFCPWTNCKSQTSRVVVVTLFVPWQFSRQHWVTHMWVAERWRIDNTHLCFASPFSYLPPGRCSFVCPMFACLSRRACMAPTGFALCRAEELSFQMDGKHFGKRLLLKREIWKLFPSTWYLWRLK